MGLLCPVPTPWNTGRGASEAAAAKLGLGWVQGTGLGQQQGDWAWLWPRPGGLGRSKLEPGLEPVRGPDGRSRGRRSALSPGSPPAIL